MMIAAVSVHSHLRYAFNYLKCLDSSYPISINDIFLSLLVYLMSFFLFWFEMSDYLDYYCTFIIFLIYFCINFKNN